MFSFRSTSRNEQHTPQYPRRLRTAQVQTKDRMRLRAHCAGRSAQGYRSVSGEAYQSYPRCCDCAAQVRKVWQTTLERWAGAGALVLPHLLPQRIFRFT